MSVLLVAQKMALSKEKYFALALDRKAAGPVAIACSEGGTSIEELAEHYPDRIVRVSIDPLVGLTDAQAATIVDGLRCSSDRADALAQVKALYRARRRACSGAVSRFVASLRVRRCFPPPTARCSRSTRSLRLTGS